MAERMWTEPQRQAIEARGGPLLVSAAAGSGKTAVLVERAIGLICGENPVDADRLLIVTFSNAAAAEMKQRIAARISSLIRERPGDLYLQRQQALLAGAQISTIHSFCLDLIRQNFQHLDIAPDFAIADPNELDILRADCAQAAVEAFYRNDGDGLFRQLVDLLSGGRDDSRLLEAVLRIHEFSRSHPFYQQWLEDKLEMYNPAIPVEETVWGRSLLRNARESLRYCAASLEGALDLTAGDEKLEKAYYPAISSDLQQVKHCLDKVEAGDWDGAVVALRGFRFEKLGPVRGEDPAKVRAKGARDRCKEILQELRDKRLNATREDFAQDMEDLEPKVRLLFRLVAEFDRRLAAAKSEKKRLDFSDLEHYALRLLVERMGGNIRPSSRAEELAARYDYVLVDEYQDTNEVQDLIFTSVSRGGGNLFMVGDVKQSIYSFRQAMPEIFLAKREAFAPYGGEGSYPAAISLDTNFRSREEVTGGVNYLFGLLMSREMGEIEYGEGERLRCGATYPPNPEARPELLVVSAADYEGEAGSLQLEAGAIARRIRELLEGGYQVTGGEGLRPCAPRDFCILLRSPKNRADVYVKELARHGVPAWAENQGGYLEAREVAAVVSLLKALDNPLLDVELAAALLSPLVGFSDDHVARIRLTRRGEPFYLAVAAAAEEGDRDCAAFLELFRELRALSATLPCDRLLLRLYERTGALAVVRAMPMGENRAANLLLLAEYAAYYHKLGYKRLGGFVSFLNRLEERGGDLSPASGMGEGANVVRIMSVHRSKGLEFPVVFLADAAKSFNKTDLRQNVLLHSRYGFACVRRDPRLLKQFPTVPMQAIRLETERSMLSEEMRILYVALTRAREKLIVTCLLPDPAKKLPGLAEDLVGGKLPPYVVGEAGSYAGWILMALAHHPAGAPLREAGGCGDLELVDDGNPWDISLVDAAEEEGGGEVVEAERTARPDPALLALLEDRAAWQYPWLDRTRVPNKLAVSTVAKGERNVEYRFSARPQFLQGGGLTAAERGNAIHKFMQFADYRAARDRLEEEIGRMESERFLTSQEVKALRRDRLRAFFRSPLADRIFASPQLHRELRFMAECGPELLARHGSYLQGMDAGSKVVLQGVADCVFEEDGGAVIVDYKSDRVGDGEELVSRYAAQLDLYREILSASLNLPVKECVIYSFHLSRAIPVPPAKLGKNGAK